MAMQNNNGNMSYGQMERARQFHQKLGRLAQPTNVISVPGKENSVSSKFPVQLGSADPMDEAMNIREQVIEPNGVVPGMGLAVADQSVFDYIQRKKENAYEVQYKMWLAKQADLSKPESQQWWFERFPWMKDNRLAEIERDAELQKALAKINVTGPQNDDDYSLLFAIEQGLIEVPRHPIHLLPRENWVQSDFKNGIFSPLSQNPNKGVKGRQGMPVSDPKIPSWSDPFGPKLQGNVPAIPGYYMGGIAGGEPRQGLFPAPGS